jgi:hypothetical protein
LCLKPEDLYKLNFVLNKVKGQGGLSNSKNGALDTSNRANLGGGGGFLELKTIGSTLDRSHNESFY